MSIWRSSSPTSTWKISLSAFLQNCWMSPKRPKTEHSLPLPSALAMMLMSYSMSSSLSSFMVASLIVGHAFQPLCVSSRSHLSQEPLCSASDWCLLPHTSPRRYQMQCHSLRAPQPLSPCPSKTFYCERQTLFFLKNYSTKTVFFPKKIFSNIFPKSFLRIVNDTSK